MDDPTRTDAPEDPPQAARADSPASNPAAAQALKDEIVAVLKTCYDPEIPVDIYELGLIYEIDVDDDANVEIKMTLTSPACPVAGSLPVEVQSKAQSVPGVGEVKVELVWDPPWDKEMMTEEARLQLGFF